MKPRQTRIFVPQSAPFDNDLWAENIFGHIIASLTRNHNFDWFWFSRYISPKEDSGDCDIGKIPEAFASQPHLLYRSVRFRFKIEDPNFESALRKAITNNNCSISDIRDYDPINDLGGDRFIGLPRTPQRIQERTELLLSQFHTTSKLVIHSLRGPNHHGYFESEIDPDSNQNPHHNIFESVHHIFCNQTNVPLRVLVSQQAIGTDWSPPQNPVNSIPVRF